MDDTDRQCPEAYCETLFETLHYAASKSMPRPKSRTRRQVWDGDGDVSLASRNPALVYVFECTYERWVSKRGIFLNREVHFTEACGILPGVTHNFFRSY